MLTQTKKKSYYTQNHNDIMITLKTVKVSQDIIIIYLSWSWATC